MGTSNSSSPAFWKAWKKTKTGGLVDPLSASTQAVNRTSAQRTSHTLQECPFIMIAHLLRVSSLFAEVETPKRTVRAAAPKKGAVILNINIINISFFSDKLQTLRFLQQCCFSFNSVVLLLMPCFTCIKQRQRSLKKMWSPALQRKVTHLFCNQQTTCAQYCVCRLSNSDTFRVGPWILDWDATSWVMHL